jgi:hypothetical protein
MKGDRVRVIRRILIRERKRTGSGELERGRERERVKNGVMNEEREREVVSDQMWPGKLGILVR